VQKYFKKHGVFNGTVIGHAPSAKIADEQRRGTTTITVELFKVLQQGLAYVCI
jgi:hypothetical protein